ncbi:MAG: RIP metalloprotease RseP [Bacteroidota bacterium]
MDILIKASQLILSLSILVVLHELGHFIPARLFKTKVEKFYLFFNWPFAILRANKRQGKWKLSWFSNAKKKEDENTEQEDEATEWGIGLLPLGGYVKIAGMVDESMDTEQLSQPPKPWEFRSKPAWQRLIIMTGGVTVNLLLGIVIYIFIMFTYGEERIYTKDLQAGLAIHPYLEKYGLYSGDNILKVEGEEVEHINDINNGILLRGARKLTVQRPDGTIETVTLPEEIDYALFQNGAFPAFELRASDRNIAELPDEDTQLKQNGFKKGDEILAINTIQVNYYDDIDKAKYLWKGKEVNVTVLRGGKDTLSLKTKLGEDGQLGYLRDVQLVDIEKIQQVYYSFGESIGKGIDRGFTTLSDYVGQLKFLFTSKGASSIGGFGTIGNLFPPLWDWQVFWLNTAFISIILAFMNILPIPALDGGHVVFLLYEMITGKEAPQKVLEYAQYIGFILLMGLILYANGNDIYRWLFG